MNQIQSWSERDHWLASLRPISPNNDNLILFSFVCYLYPHPLHLLDVGIQNMMGIHNVAAIFCIPLIPSLLGYKYVSPNLYPLKDQRRDTEYGRYTEYGVTICWQCFVHVCSENVLQKFNSNWFSFPSFKNVLEIFSVKCFENILAQTFLRPIFSEGLLNVDLQIFPNRDGGE